MPARAQPVLERVRLQGPQSSRAHCSAWAGRCRRWAAIEDALTPWLELRDRNLLDAAVQEAYLAVPYAYAQLGAGGQAAEYYEQALTSFAAERAASMRRSRACAPAISRMNWWAVTTSTRRSAAGSGSCRTLPDEPESRYLYPILAGNDFQEGLKNYPRPGLPGLHAGALGREHGRLRRHDRGAREGLCRAHAAHRCAAGQRCARRSSRRVARSWPGASTMWSITRTSQALGTPEQRDQWQRIADLEVDADDAAAGRRRPRHCATSCG